MARQGAPDGAVARHTRAPRFGYRGALCCAILGLVTGTKMWIEHDPDAGVWRWWFTGRDGVYREGEADTYAAASLAGRKAMPPLLRKTITPPGYEIRNRGGGGVAGSR
ncbi:hypothetical protein C8E95_2538 [Pseudonocardia autotrophica]|uniref:Uncharacterized protein n=2 Tax=Pseudonocardia TaxID=1847 RepID=A0A1Y2N9I8_PSEAH|nr:hypothetical protein BG845_00511 [Pseudonocardia autotrophica]TDN73441.1 hypothetical protein C8E95_2538 [Pseudonocardia autotrophica]